MSYHDVMGPSHDGEDVEEAVRTFLQKWIETYMLHVEEEKGLQVGSHRPPRTWRVTGDDKSFPEDRLPIVLVVYAGTGGGLPKADGRGYYRAFYGIGVVTIASGKDWDSSRRNAYIYATAIRNALLQRSSCETDFIRGVDWQGDQPDPVPAEQGRSLAAVKSAYLVEASSLVNSRAYGPGAPASTPPPSPTQIKEGGGHLTIESEGDQ